MKIAAFGGMEQRQNVKEATIFESVAGFSAELASPQHMGKLDDLTKCATLINMILKVMRGYYRDGLKYRRRLSSMSRQEMKDVYRRCYEDLTDANKDWLLGQIVESIQAERN